MSTARNYDGAKYVQGRDVAETARLIRADIKAAKNVGMIAPDLTVSVTSERFSGGVAINVKIVSPRPIFAANPCRESEPWVTHAETGAMVTSLRDRYTSEALQALSCTEQIVDAFQSDHSDTQLDHWDIAFYGSVRISTAEGVEIFLP